MYKTVWEKSKINSVPDSLIDITRKQNLNRGLYHIADDLFELFIHLSQKCLSLLNEERFYIHGYNLHSYCLAELLKSPTLSVIVERVEKLQESFSMMSATHQLHCCAIYMKKLSGCFFLCSSINFEKTWYNHFRLQKQWHTRNRYR